MANKIDNWLMDLIDEFRYEPLNDMLKSNIEYKVRTEMPKQFPGDYEISVEWVDGSPFINIKFVHEHEHTLFMLKYT